MNIIITVANDSHFQYSQDICDMIEAAAKLRGTGIAKREPEYIKLKMTEGKAIISIDTDTKKAIGFCYIECWDDGKFVANSGLIVHPDYRNQGLAKKIKQRTFELSKHKFPEAKLFGITTSLGVMKINSELGYKPVTFSELTTDDRFWAGCQTCVNYDILMRNNRKMCLCTGMMCDLKNVKLPTEKQHKSNWETFKNFFKQRQIRIKDLIKKNPTMKNVFNLLF